MTENVTPPRAASEINASPEELNVWERLSAWERIPYEELPIDEWEPPWEECPELFLKGNEAREYLKLIGARAKRAIESTVELVVFTKTEGVLSKRISLQSDGSVLSDGSECIMPKGTARRVHVFGLRDFARVVGGQDPDQALALGRLRRGLADDVEVVTKSKLTANPGAIARTSEFIGYREGAPAYALIDFDRKGMPAEVSARIDELGGFWAALVSVAPELQSTARIIRSSTSAGLFRSDTSERFEGSGGLHVYLLVKDGADIERFLRTLHARCWLFGLGWHMLGAGGQLLERSIVDRMVGAPERLVFEGRPTLVPPLNQDAAARRPEIFDGAPLDTATACPPLTIVEKSKLHQALAKSTVALAPEKAKAREKFVVERAKEMSERKGISIDAARTAIERQCEGVLLPNVVLPFDDPALSKCTVADVLANPTKFEGETLADPIEGVGYGRCKAKIYQRSDGTPWIRSFAHGFTRYELKHDASSVRAAVDACVPALGTGAIMKLLSNADVSAPELDELVEAIHTKFEKKVGKRAIKKQLDETKKTSDEQAKSDKRQRDFAERNDPRPRIVAPRADAEWLPVMNTLNDVIGASKAPHPLARDGLGYLTVARRTSLPNMHKLTAVDSNGERDENYTGIPAPDQWTLSRLSEVEAAEVIERHIEFFDPEDMVPVHLATPFVKHFMCRNDEVLPTIHGVTTMPIVLADGTILALDGLDRERGIDFRIPPEVLRFVPRRGDVDDDAVRAAMKFLVDEWLCDVATDLTGKCLLISCALTLIERSLLPERPAYFIVAGRRGSGKTTAIAMLIRAVTGEWPAAAAWSPSDEERRKALLAYLMRGVPYILWDNIARGTQISCAHIEKAITSPTYSDRILGRSEDASPAATTVQIFTGNNVWAKGDLASRSLRVELTADRHDPENRQFRHPHPLEWTDANRGRILHALYTIMLGNPQLRKQLDAPGETRFKMWWRLVGSAVEYAAELVDEKAKIKFKDLFIEGEDDDADSMSLADALNTLDKKWPKAKQFTADDVLKLVDSDIGRNLREFLFPDPKHNVTKLGVSKAMNAHIGNPVRSGERELTLRATQDSHTKKRSYWVNVYSAGGDEVAAEVAEDGVSEVCHAAADDFDEDIPF